MVTSNCYHDLHKCTYYWFILLLTVHPNNVVIFQVTHTVLIKIRQLHVTNVLSFKHNRAPETTLWKLHFVYLFCVKQSWKVNIHSSMNQNPRMFENILNAVNYLNVITLISKHYSYSNDIITQCSHFWYS